MKETLKLAAAIAGTLSLVVATLIAIPYAAYNVLMALFPTHDLVVACITVFLIFFEAIFTMVILLEM